jgi:hypothetical protein
MNSTTEERTVGKGFTCQDNGKIPPLQLQVSLMAMIILALEPVEMCVINQAEEFN